MLDDEVGALSAEQRNQIKMIYEAGYQLMESVQEKRQKRLYCGQKKNHTWNEKQESLRATWKA